MYDAAIDGAIILRYMAGFQGDAISAGLLNPSPACIANPQFNTPRCPSDIATYLNNIRTQLDIDADNVLNPATDGQLIVRWMRGMALSASYIQNVRNTVSGTRLSEDEITSVLSQMMP